MCSKFVTKTIGLGKERVGLQIRDRLGTVADQAARCEPRKELQEGTEVAHIATTGSQWLRRSLLLQRRLLLRISSWWSSTVSTGLCCREFRCKLCPVSAFEM